MSVEFIGHIFPHEFSETIAASGPVIQPDYLRALAKAHEASGFDKVLMLRFSVSLRPIVAGTEEAAWARAEEILRVTEQRAGAFTKGFPTQRNEGSERLLRFAADHDVHDERLFTALAKATGAAGNSTALVGTPAQIADALLAHVDAGASTLLIRGYEPYDDAVAYGEVISLVRERALVSL